MHYCNHLCLLLLFSCSVLSHSLWTETVALQAPLSMGFARQEYWKWVAISCSRGSSNPGTDLASHALAGFFTTESSGKPTVTLISWLKCSANQILSPLRTEGSVLVFCWSSELQEAKCRDATLCHDWTRVLVLAHKAVSKTEIVRQPLKGLQEWPHQMTPLPQEKQRYRSHWSTVRSKFPKFLPQILDLLYRRHQH